MGFYLIGTVFSLDLFCFDTENFVWKIAVCICSVPEKCPEGSVDAFKPRMIRLLERQRRWSRSHAAFLQQQNLSLSAGGQAGLLRSLHQTRMDLPLGNDKRRARLSWLQHLRLLWDPHTLHAADHTDHPPTHTHTREINWRSSCAANWFFLTCTSGGFQRAMSGDLWVKICHSEEQKAAILVWICPAAFAFAEGFYLWEFTRGKRRRQ